MNYLLISLARECMQRLAMHGDQSVFLFSWNVWSMTFHFMDNLKWHKRFMKKAMVAVSSCGQSMPPCLIAVSSRHVLGLLNAYFAWFLYGLVLVEFTSWLKIGFSVLRPNIYSKCVINYLLPQLVCSNILRPISYVNLKKWIISWGLKNVKITYIIG